MKRKAGKGERGEVERGRRKVRSVMDITETASRRGEERADPNTHEVKQGVNV